MRFNLAHVFYTWATNTNIQLTISTILIRNISLSGPFETLVEKFQKAIKKHYEDGGTSLDNAQTMKNFSQKHAPALFNRILNSICQQDLKDLHRQKGFLRPESSHSFSHNDIF